MSLRRNDESQFLGRLLIKATDWGARLFRNQVGQYRLARPECVPCQRHGRVMRSGLCVGSSDVIGWMPVTITAEHVGQTLALFMAIEAKSATGRPTTEQQAFLRVVHGHGGIALIARSESDVEMALAPWLRA